jgi:hypothetical protein
MNWHPTEARVRELPKNQCKRLGPGGRRSFAPKFPSVSYLPHRKPISQGSFLRPISRGKLGSSILCSNPRSGTVVKFLIATGATLALVTAAAAADIPRRQPVYQTAQVGKMPIGKTPIGKTPIGKAPVYPGRY